MKQIIHRLRSQPESVKRHILHALSACIAVVLILLWVYSLGANLTNPAAKVKANNDLKPFSALRDNLVGGYKSIYESKTEATE